MSTVRAQMETNLIYSFHSDATFCVSYYTSLLFMTITSTGNIGQIPTWVKLGSNLGNNNSQLLKLGSSWGKVGFYFKS